MYKLYEALRCSCVSCMKPSAGSETRSGYRSSTSQDSSSGSDYKSEWDTEEVLKLTCFTGTKAQMLTQKALQDESSQWETEQTEQSEEERGTKGGGQGSRSERGGQGARGHEQALRDVARERRHGVQGLQTGGGGVHALRYAGGSEGKVEERKADLMKKVSLFAPALSVRGSGDPPARGGGERVRHKLKSLRGHPSAVNPQVEYIYIHMHTHIRTYIHLTKKCVGGGTVAARAVSRRDGAGHLRQRGHVRCRYVGVSVRVYICM